MSQHGSGSPGAFIVDFTWPFPGAGVAMGIEHLDRMFSPKSIAVIGASGKAGRAGRVIVENLRAGGFAGEIALVNPGYDSLKIGRAHF